MTIRYPIIVFMSLGMLLHALLVGRYLGSLYFLAAFSWSWVAVTAMRGNLASAQAMVQTMIALVGASLFLSIAAASDIAKFMPLVSLALVPGLISWVCMLIYIRHIRFAPDEEHDPWVSDAFVHGTRRALPGAGIKPRLAAPSLPRDETLPGAPVDAGELTPQEIARIIGAATNKPPVSDAA